MNHASQHHSTSSLEADPGLELGAPLPDAARPLLPTGLRNLLGALSRRYRDEVDALLAARQERQRRFDAGELPDFPEETRDIREGDWKVARIPEDLRNRRVEITGPVDRKMIINALNSGAMVFMADFEDSSTPSWDNMISGQVNLQDAVRGTIEFTADSGKQYRLEPDPAVLIVRPRGWHLDESMCASTDALSPAGCLTRRFFSTTTPPR